jgi:hypothetical protein
MREAVAFRDQLLDWVYEKAGGSLAENVPILEFTERAGLDGDGAYTLLRFCHDAGVLNAEHSGSGNPCAMITSAGIADVLERRRRLADPAERARVGRSELLRWFYRQRVAGAHLPMTDEFARDPGRAHESLRLTNLEIQDAAGYLADKKLINGITVPELRGPVRAEITSEGVDCVTDWAGDVARYLRDQRGPGPTHTYNGPYIEGGAHGSQLAWQNDSVHLHQYNQQVAPGFEPLAEAVATILKRLPALELVPDDQRDVEEAANEVLAEVHRPNPEPRKIRRVVAALKGFLLPIAVEAARGEVRELAQQGIDHLNSAL